MTERLLCYITEQHERKTATNSVPTYTTAIEAANALGISRSRVVELAKRLEDSGKIRIGRTISDNYFQIVYSYCLVNDNSERRVLPADQP